MNLYVRYFDREYLAKSVEDAIGFLQSIEEIKLESNAASRITTFLSSSNIYPFRLKVSYSNYVLFLKTEAETLEQFKEEEALRKEQKLERVVTMAERKKITSHGYRQRHLRRRSRCPERRENRLVGSRADLQARLNHPRDRQVQVCRYSLPCTAQSFQRDGCL